MDELEEGRRINMRWIALPVLLFLSLFVWSTDRVSLQGERTVYTVNCVNGAWTGERCSGTLVAGPRFRYRALKAHMEVLFWVLGAQEPSSKLSGCTIEDGRNWTCPEGADAVKSLTLGMARGEPMRNPAWHTLPFHAVPKLTWWLLQTGFGPAQLVAN